MISHQSAAGRSETRRESSKNGRVALDHLYMHLDSPLFPSFHCRAGSTVIPLLPKANFMPSIQPNLGLPRTSPPLTSANYTFLTMRSYLFSPRVQTISILSDPLYSPAPLLFQFYDAHPYS